MKTFGRLSPQDSQDFRHVIDCLVHRNYTPNQVRNRVPHFYPSLLLLEEAGRNLRTTGHLDNLARELNEYLLREILRRDSGICALCKLDTIALHLALGWFAAHRLPSMVTMAQLKGALGRIARRWPRRLWDMDHCKPISKGGSVYALSNLRTLCLECHYLETNRLIHGHKLPHRTFFNRGLSEKTA